MAEPCSTIGLTEGQTAARRLVVLGSLVVVLVLLGAAALLAAGSKALDDLQAREDRALVTGVIERRLHRIVTDLTTSTVWNQAYRELRPGGDPDWLDDEIGSYFANNRGHDLTIALDRTGRPFYAWAGSGLSAPDVHGEFLADADVVIRRARRLEAERGDKAPELKPTTPALSETAAGVIRSGQTVYLVAASTVTPESADVPREPGPSALLVSAQRLRHELPGLLGDLGITGVQIHAEPISDAASIVLRDPGDRIVGSVSWDQRHPGLEILRGAAPVVAGGLSLLLAAMAALGWQIWRVLRRLDAHERGHAAALYELEFARDLAEAANIAKSQFLANMSHEIRTPLNGVLGMAQVLARSDLSPADLDKVNLIRASGETLLSLLNDLLDLSKIEAGRMELDVHDFDLATEVDLAIRAFATLAGQKDVRLALDIESGARGQWRGDAGRIRQVLTNLVSNAVKFTSAGEVRVSLRRSEVGLACAVTDTGAGIARERIPDLFQRFSQVDPSATRRHGGTGLGLAIVRELVELMGGTVAVASVEGRGSVFTFELPIPWVGSVETGSPEVDLDADLPPLRILAAEDNRTNQLLLSAMLEPLGVEIRMASDGAETLAAFQAERFDLVLMDIQMPVMNGVDATRAIRALERERGLQATPILALSANVMRHQVEEYLAAGMNGFIAKPIEMAVLIDAIERALADREAASRAAA
jgi:signal transduction histidine kinase/ActR/RegA family two-component response regulator